MEGGGGQNLPRRTEEPPKHRGITVLSNSKKYTYIQMIKLLKETN